MTLAMDFLPSNSILEGRGEIKDSLCVPWVACIPTKLINKRVNILG